MSYCRRDRRINYLSNKNSKYANIILNELENDCPNSNVLDNCFNSIKLNQIKMAILIHKNVIRCRQKSRKE